MSMQRINIVFYILLVSTCLNAQNTGDIETHEIKIVKDYNVFIEEADKIVPPINYKPQFQDKSAAKKISYTLPDRIEHFKFEPSAVTPLPYKMKEIGLTEKNYLKIGAGSLLNPILEWSHQSLNKKTPVSIHLIHHSAWLEDLPAKPFSKTNFDSRIQWRKNHWMISPNFDFQHLFLHFYGNAVESQESNIANRSYGTGKLGLDLNLEQHDTKKTSLDNNLEVLYGAENLKTRFINSPNNNELGAKWSSKLNYHYNENALISLGGGIQYYHLTNGLSSEKLFFNLYPHLQYSKKAFKLNGGINLISASITGSDSKIYALPKLSTEVQLISNYVNLHSSWERVLEINTMRQLMTLNPFGIYQQNMVIPNTLVENRSAGIKGDIHGFQYNTYAHMRIMKNALLMANDSLNPKYLISQVEKNMTSTNLSLELTYNKLSHWSLRMKGDLFFYELDNLPYAYNLPRQQLALGISYKPTNKWVLTLESMLLGGIQSRIQGLEVQLPIQSDLNLGVEFQISKKFHIFANMNNVLNTNFARQIGYPIFGTNGQFGLRILY